LGIIGNGRYGADAITVFASVATLAKRIVVFTISAFVIVFVCGTLMYAVEGGKQGFQSIPAAIYWAIVTVTTVGYGDIVPVTPLGRTLAVFLMLLAYGVVATGVFSGSSTQAPPLNNTDAFFYEFFHQHQMSLPTSPAKKPKLEEKTPPRLSQLGDGGSDRGSEDLGVRMPSIQSSVTTEHAIEEEEISQSQTSGLNSLLSTPMKDPAFQTPRKTPLHENRQQLVKKLLLSPLSASFSCSRCGVTGHLQDSLFCRTCGTYLRGDPPT